MQKPWASGAGAEASRIIPNADHLPDLRLSRLPDPMSTAPQRAPETSAEDLMPPAEARARRSDAALGCHAPCLKIQMESELSNAPSGCIDRASDRHDL